ncbi:MAG: sigma-54-dependent Fis family transcriptional regulator [Nitrospirae bacterium]|nr:sigma-54-dependent Fis family transcriptional regulator [Nitrospirota bacterium]
MANESVLLVEDDDRMRHLLDLLLTREGYRVIPCAQGKEAVQRLQEEDIDLVLSDLQLGDMNGIDLLQPLRRSQPETPLIIITAHGTIPSAVEAMRQGAFDYLQKPLDHDRLKWVIRRALQIRQLDRENRALKQQILSQFGFDGILGECPAIRRVKEQAREVAAADTTVLIMGESGTGKELLARAIHYESPRRGGPLVTLNCAAIPEPLIESELFGVARGAFTDARQDRPGRLLQADGGTLFLDEVAELSRSAQAKLLRVLETRTVEPLGGGQEKKVDFRIIAATNQDLLRAVRQGKFREDLYYRLHVMPLHLPPLRDRGDDLDLLVSHFLRRFNEELGRQIRGVTPDGMAALKQRAWPGNVRELENLLERITLTHRGEWIDAKDLPPDHVANPLQLAFRTLLAQGWSLDQLQARILNEALHQTGGNLTQAAQLLQMDRSTFRYRLKKINPGGEYSPPGG